MPDQGTRDSVTSKFSSWAESLSAEEQEALAEWWSNVNGDDVGGHSDANWWQQPGAWSQAWADSWSW